MRADQSRQPRLLWFLRANHILKLKPLNPPSASPLTSLHSLLISFPPSPLLFLCRAITRSSASLHVNMVKQRKDLWRFLPLDLSCVELLLRVLMKVTRGRPDPLTSQLAFPSRLFAFVHLHVLEVNRLHGLPDLLLAFPSLWVGNALPSLFLLSLLQLCTCFRCATSCLSLLLPPVLLPVRSFLLLTDSRLRNHFDSFMILRAQN